jgi:hypothetical protein
MNVDKCAAVIPYCEMYAFMFLAELEYYQKCVHDLEKTIRNFSKANDKR